MKSGNNDKTCGKPELIATKGFREPKRP